MRTNKKSLLRWFKSLILLVTVSAMVAGCKKDIVNTEASGLNVVNASPGTNPFNVTLNGRIVSGPALAYNEQSGYFRAAVGTLTLGVIPGGSAGAVTTQTINLVKSQYHTAFVIGPSAGISILQTDDDMTAPPTGKAKVRFLNLGFDAPNLNLTTSTGTALFSNLGFKGVSSFSVIDPGSYSFQIKNATSGSTLATLDKTLEAGYIYTFYATGLVSGAGSTPLSLQVQAVIN